MTAVLALLLVVAAFFGSTAFAAVYQIRNRWWVTDVGRNQMAFAVTEAGILGLSLFEAAIGPFPGMAVVNLATFAVFAGVIWWRLLVLLRTRPKRRIRVRRSGMNRWLLVWVSALTGLQALAAAGALADVVGVHWALAVGLVSSAAQAATITYQHGLNTPTPVHDGVPPMSEGSR